MEPGSILSFNQEQRQAIDHRNSPLRIIAGAGTGKTATLTARFVQLVQQDGIAIGDILALTFTRKAANEMKVRIIEQLDQSYSEFWVETFHAFCQRILRIERGRRGLPAPTVIDGQARRALLEKAIAGHDFPAYGSRQTELVRQAMVLIDRAKDELKKPADILRLARARNDAQLHDLATAYDLYQSALTFGDRDFDWGELQTRIIKMFENDPAILQRWKSQFKHILVDEYQDINRAQSRLIALLAGDGRNLTVVGDVDQSIYAFRGASHTFLSDMPNHYPGTTTVHLSRNFRSHQDILDVANALISGNESQREPLVAFDGGRGPVPIVIEAHDEHEEARAIARRIANLHWVEHVPLSRVAVLLRSVQVSAQPIEHALAGFGIRSTYADPGQTGDEAVADVLAVLRSIDSANAGDLIRLLASQGTDAVEIAAAQIDARRNGADLLTYLTECQPRIAPLASRAIAAISGLACRPLPEQVYEAAVICGRLPLGETISKGDYHYVRSLGRMIERATQITERGGTRQQLIDELTAGIDPAHEVQTGSSAVQIMTVHAAKGLEFDQVFVAGLVDGRFPLKRRLDRGLDLTRPESLHGGDRSAMLTDADRRREFLEEERRLGYVATTRARHHLYLSRAQSYAQSQSAHSTFLAEIRGVGDELLSPSQPEQVFHSSTTELARLQHESIAKALDTSELSGDSVGNLMLAQWTLNELPEAAPWRASPAPTPFTGDESLRLSFSALDNYDTCARRYYYGHVLGLQDDRSSPYTRRGTAVHKAVQWMNERRRDAVLPSDRELIEHYRSSWNPAGFESVSQERQIRQQCERLLRRFHAHEREQEREILDVEVRFEVPLGQHQLTGQIDCVARRPDGTVEIIDYKTSKEVSGAKQNLQLGIYQIAYSYLHPEATPEAVIYLLGHKNDRHGSFVPEFDPGKQVKNLASGSDVVAETTESILDTAGRILLNRFEVTTKPYDCRGCAFRHVCQGANEDG